MALLQATQVRVWQHAWTRQAVKLQAIGGVCGHVHHVPGVVGVCFLFMYCDFDIHIYIYIEYKLSSIYIYIYIIHISEHMYVYIYIRT